MINCTLCVDTRLGIFVIRSHLNKLVLKNQVHMLKQTLHMSILGKFPMIVTGFEGLLLSSPATAR